MRAAQEQTLFRIHWTSGVRELVAPALYSRRNTAGGRVDAAADEEGCLARGKAGGAERLSPPSTVQYVDPRPTPDAPPTTTGSSAAMPDAARHQ